jgi:hypothetical protein
MEVAAQRRQKNLRLKKRTTELKFGRPLANARLLGDECVAMALYEVVRG